MENNLSDEFKKALKASPELQKALSTNAGLMEQMVGFQNKLFTIQKEAYDYQKDTSKPKGGKVIPSMMPAGRKGTSVKKG